MKRDLSDKLTNGKNLQGIPRSLDFGANCFQAHACLLAANSRYFDVLLKTTESGRPEGEPTSLPFPTDDHRVKFCFTCSTQNLVSSRDVDLL